MKALNLIHYWLLLLLPVCAVKAQTAAVKEIPLMGNRFLTLNTVIRVNQIEVSRDRNVGQDERSLHTPERVVNFRTAIAKGFPGARITWAFSWLALHDTTENYRRIRAIVGGYHAEYGDEITFLPGAYFANAYNSTEQVNKDLHDGILKVSAMVGRNYRPLSILAGFLSSKNQEYLAKVEGIHVCQGNIWSQYSIDNQDGDGSVCYPFYPSLQHFCKPAQGKEDFVDCVNLDGWTVDFLAGRRAGFKDGFNSRMGVGPIETLGRYGLKTGLEEMMHTTAIHFDKGFELNGFAWVTNCWELSLPYDVGDMTLWLQEIRKRWPDVRCIMQGEFGLAILSGVNGDDAKVIDLTRYDLPAKEPESGTTRNWSLLGEINQKGLRKRDQPVAPDELPPADKALIKKHYPGVRL